jgi:RNA polymerase sigma-70 factor (ECF subfamily)
VDDDADERLKASLVRDLDAGFRLLVEVHGPTLRVTALRLTGHAQDAEDLAAECLLRAFRGLLDRPAEWVAGLDLRAWLLTILLNTWRNELRTRSRRPRTTQPPEHLDTEHLDREHSDARAGQPTSGAASPEASAVALDTRTELAGHLAGLPPRQREAVVLRHVLDLPIAEVARILGTPEGTAKSHVSRGLSALRASYLHSPDDQGQR